MLLARAAGIPARVVSGWSIARTKGTQTVFTDQAHQWAEVAFEGLGWVAFEPTPGRAAGPNATSPPPSDHKAPTADQVTCSTKIPTYEGVPPPSWGDLGYPFDRQIPAAGPFR